MNTNSALIKNRNHRWRIQIEGTTLSHEVELNVDAASLVAFAEEQMQKGMEIDEAGAASDGIGAEVSFPVVLAE